VLVPGMSSGRHDNKEECIGLCSASPNCAWLGHRTTDNYCECWAAGSCINPHYQPKHDVYQFFKPQEQITTMGQHWRDMLNVEFSQYSRLQAYPTRLQTNPGVAKVSMDGNWVPICGHWFCDNRDGADTFCQSLGYDSEMLTNTDGNGEGNCDGICRSNSVGCSLCAAGQNAGFNMTCLRQQQAYPTRLQTNPGVAEVSIDGNWVPICGHWFWDNRYGADTFCQSLGYASGMLTNLGATLDRNAMCVGNCKVGEKIGDCWGEGNCRGDCRWNSVGCSLCAAGRNAGFNMTCLRQQQAYPTRQPRVITTNQPAKHCRDLHAFTAGIFLVGALH